MRLSVLDLAPVPAGGSAVDALANTVELARLAEQCGYDRFWVAEHHGDGATRASSNPEVVIARVAGATTRIRVGSGAVLLGDQSPFRVAETYRLLHAMFPGRIDLGMGRATSAPTVDLALRRGRRDQRLEPAADWAGPLAATLALIDHEEQIREVSAWLDARFPDDHPFAQIEVLPGVTGGPEPWVLGSSTASAVIAARLGMRYCFAGFLDPGGARAALQTYRRTFEGSGLPSGTPEPHAMLGVSVACAPTDEEAARLRSSAELVSARLREGIVHRGPLPSPDEAVAALGAVPATWDGADRGWPQHLSGGPERVRTVLEQMASHAGADEIILHDLIADPRARSASLELIAYAFELAAATAS